MCGLVFFLFCWNVFDIQDRSEFCKNKTMQLSYFHGYKFECKNETESIIFTGFIKKECQSVCLTMTKWGDCIEKKEYDCIYKIYGDLCLFDNRSC